MVCTPIFPAEIEFSILLLTCFIELVKFIMLVFMGVKIHRRKKEGLELAVAFLRAMWVLIFTLFVSRLFYMWFDFGLTHFDLECYAEHAVWWKIAQFIIGIGLAEIVFVIDRKILGFKLKGIFAYIIVAGSVVMFLWPVNNAKDFADMSTMSILPQLGMLVVFVVFLNIAVKSTGRVRKTALIIIFAFLLYTVAALLVNAGLVKALTDVFGPIAAFYLYMLQSIFKAAGIIMMAAGAARWGN
ncbi:MAG: hypothetical protein JW839_10920 [Candidatus Lokiarchaeota archaeon]|nr:hypothetical protein [Candidatus Lokiarchaeota archaeon]